MFISKIFFSFKEGDVYMEYIRVGVSKFKADMYDRGTPVITEGLDYVEAQVKVELEKGD
jgi:hypothetical protein